MIQGMNKSMKQQLTESRVNFLMSKLLKEAAVQQPTLIEITNNAPEFGILSAYKKHEAFEVNVAKTQELKKDMSRMGYKFISQDGLYDKEQEESFIIIGATNNDIAELSKRYQQESYIFARRDEQSPCGYVFTSYMASGEGENIHYTAYKSSITILENEDVDDGNRPYTKSCNYKYIIQGIY